MAAEFAPAQVAHELVDVGQKHGVPGRDEPRGVPDLPRADLAKTQMGRQPGGAAAVGPVALAAVAHHAITEKLFEPRARRRLTRRPGFAQSGGPVRLDWLKPPAFDRVACKVRYGGQHLRARQGRGGIAESLYTPPERREYAQALALLVTDVGGVDQQVTGKGLRCDAPWPERRDHLIGQGLMRRLRNLVPEHRSGAGLARQRCD